MAFASSAGSPQPIARCRMLMLAGKALDGGPSARAGVGGKSPIAPDTRPAARKKGLEIMTPEHIEALQRLAAAVNEYSED